MIGIQITPINIEAGAPSDDQIDSGDRPLVEVAILGGTALPLADPRSPGQPVVVPTTRVTFPLTPEDAINLGKALVEHGERLPKSPSIEIATSLDGVEQASEAINQFRG